MTTFVTRVMACDDEWCTRRVEALGTLTDLRNDATKQGWSWNTGPDEDRDLCPSHTKKAVVS